MKTKNFTLSAVLILLAGFSGFAQPTNNNISNAITFDGEPYVAMNPANPQNLVAAWMGVKLSGGAYKIAVTTRASFDGGNTWSAINTLPHNGTGFTSADVSLAFAKSGLVYLSFVDYNETANQGGDYISRSYDGGVTWDSATLTVGLNEDPGKDPLDRPWLVVDKSNTANAGTLYLTTKPAYWIPPPNRNYYKVSTDSGFTWSALANVDGGNYLVGNDIAQPMAAPATTANGHFCAIYPSYLPSQNILPAYYLATSADQGHSFTYSTVIAAIPSAVDTNLKAGYRLQADPVDSNKLIAITVDGSNGDADIMAMHSNDGGQTWSSRIRVNDDSIHNGKAQDLVWCNYNEEGNLIATWRDRRNSPDTGFWNAGYDFYYAVSTDNGATFSANQKLSSQFIAFDSLIAEKGNDFMSCVYHHDTLYTVWGDTRNSAMNIYFTKTVVSTNSTVDIQELQNEEGTLRVFPNPAKDMLTVEVSRDNIGQPLTVFDAKGNKVYTSQISSAKIQVPISTWSSGTYFIRVDEEVKKMVKE